jgi:hypothetical protein
VPYYVGIEYIADARSDRVNWLRLRMVRKGRRAIDGHRINGRGRLSFIHIILGFWVLMTHEGGFG